MTGERILRLGLGVAALLLAAAPAAHSAPVASPASAAESVAEVRDYWTSERMREAKPLELARPGARLADSLDLRAAAGAGKLRSGRSSYAAVTQTNTTTAGTRTHGKIFFSIGADDLVCSGTAINSPNKSTVWTAAHCIWDADTDSFVTNLIFVPGYNVGVRPFGSWVAVDAYVPSNWITSDGLDSRDDVGALRTQVKRRSKTIREKRRCNRRFEKRRKRRRCKRKKVPLPIVDKVGGRGIVFNQDPSDFTYRAFGYPASPTPRFDGEHMELCTSVFTGVDSSFGANPKPIGIECDMQGGASGGGWVISGGRVNGNVSYGYPGVDDNHFYSPYFDNFTRAFYDSVKSLP